MPSLVLYDDDYSRAMADGTLDPAGFDHVFLCEGDSWMDRSSLYQLSLPWALAQSFTARTGRNALFINLARFGDTMRGIADCARDGLLDQWINTQGLPFRFDALLLSAGGNDFIDEALKGAGNGILHGVAGAPPTLTVDDCYNVNAVIDLVDHTIDPAFDATYSLVRSSRHADLPIFLNCYHVPVARPAPAWRGGKAWLSRAYDINGIPRKLWPELTERIFIDVAGTVTGWVTDAHTGLHVVPTTTAGLVPAAPGSTGSSGDWINEIHPNASGWRKLADCWLGALQSQGVVAPALS